MITLTKRSMDYLKKQGYYSEKVEYFNHFSHTRHDMLGIVDILALNGSELLAVQTTSTANAAARLKKARACKPLALWIEAGGNFIVHGWAKKGNRWQLTERSL